MGSTNRPNRDAEAFTLRIIYEDNHLLGVYKPGGMLVQGDRTGDTTLLTRCKEHLKRKYDKPGNVFLGLVHRLDRPVSGVVLFARTSKAVSRLSNEFRLRRVKKRYLAVVVGRPSKREGEMVAQIERAHLKSRIVTKESDRSKEAVLTYRHLASTSGSSLVEVTPRTGRHHQIRVQLADAGHPIVGDVKYGAREMLPDKTIALHAGFLEVKHPTQDRTVVISAAPPRGTPWTEFAATIDNLFR